MQVYDLKVPRQDESMVVYHCFPLDENDALRTEPTVYNRLRTTCVRVSNPLLITKQQEHLAHSRLTCFFTIRSVLEPNIFVLLGRAIQLTDLEFDSGSSTEKKGLALEFSLQPSTSLELSYVNSMHEYFLFIMRQKTRVSLLFKCIPT